MVVLILFSCSSCHVGYLVRVGKDHFSLIANSVPVEEVLNNDELTEDQKSMLRLVAGVKAFGEDSLGLRKTGNYSTAYIEYGAPIYLVSASPKDRLVLKTWWFPIVGDIAYLGFYRLKEAREERARLLKEDMDVVIGQAEAYSTLGWLSDPVTLNMIKGSVNELVEIVLHEMTHATLYVKGQGEFNEGLASFVGKLGTLQFMEKTYGVSHPFAVEARHLIHDERLFSSFLAHLLEKLEKLYDSSSDYSEKMIFRGKIFDTALNGYKSLMPEFQTDRYKYFGRYRLNNARLLLIGLYHRNFGLFESVLQKNRGSIKDMILFLKDLEKGGGDMLSRMSVHLSSLPDSGPIQVEMPSEGLSSECIIQ